MALLSRRPARCGTVARPTARAACEHRERAGPAPRPGGQRRQGAKLTNGPSDPVRAGADRLALALGAATCRTARYDGQMSKSSDVDRDREIRSQFEAGMSGWGSAVLAHRLAPPDQDFAARLAALARGASEAARGCAAAGAAGFEWPPARKADSEPPYELRPGTGRRGPEALWVRFDEAVTRLRVVAAGRDILEVARGYEDLATVAGELAEAVAAEDRASAAAPRARARRPA